MLRLLRLSSARAINKRNYVKAFHAGSSSPAIFAQHRDTRDNTKESSFDFTTENYTKVHAILDRYPENFKASAIIPLLDLAQRQHGGWLPLAAMNKVARIVDVKPIQVYEVATFYTMFNREKVGKFFIQLCGTTPCMICGSEEIKHTIEEHLGIKEGETTKDGMFTLREVECLGACANAPMVQINDDFYENLTPETTKELLEACKCGQPPKMSKWGSLPLNGQLSCEGPQGKTSLLWDKHPPPGFRMRPDSELQPKVDPKKIKEEMLY
uniref:NADH dehydrogenase flavoprotein 2 putative n=1 Tax=Albugo laibachii Nc14 TaxID=890382 RepID=F0WD42_9STRA|nr:NADH dehydrogenase flavoprotein 2 putative [Albugo laibachii Nc14]|eukprot:CCA19114.1 NADH dehydrogenase flavoprotein 2 putative [Albugo laibachii Nc14]